MTTRNEHGLTPQMEAFAQAVSVGDDSQAGAYRKAYPKALNWKADTVHQAASRLMADSKIRARISALQKQHAENAGLNAKAVLEELRRIVHSDIRSIISPDGKIKMPNELTPAESAGVASVKVDEYGRIEYKFWDKNAAIDKAMKHLGLYKEDNDQNNKPFVPTIIELRPLQPPTKAKKGED